MNHSVMVAYWTFDNGGIPLPLGDFRDHGGSRASVGERAAATLQQEFGPHWRDTFFNLHVQCDVLHGCLLESADGTIAYVRRETILLA